MRLCALLINSNIVEEAIVVLKPNIYLEQGVIGLFLYFTFFVLVIISVIRLYKDKTSDILFYAIACFSIYYLVLLF